MQISLTAPGARPQFYVIYDDEINLATILFASDSRAECEEFIRDSDDNPRNLVLLERIAR